MHCSVTDCRGAWDQDRHSRKDYAECIRIISTVTVGGIHIKVSEYIGAALSGRQTNNGIPHCSVKKPNPETHQACRSLLQKAVRRGNVALATQVASHLEAVGDRRWLLGRASVIAVEECWPTCFLFESNGRASGPGEVLARVSRAAKLKDAAGLGTLSYAFSKGDMSVLQGNGEDRDIRVVAAGIERPRDFWAWATVERLDEKQDSIVQGAFKAFRRGGWPWDRAFMQAAAYLAVTRPIPEVEVAAPEPSDFPFWIALDKHTPEGKRALSNAAKIAGVPHRQAVWTSFYFESAVSNHMAFSPWWTREICWRLSKIGLDYDRAKAIWSVLRPVMAHCLTDAAQALERHVQENSAEQTQLL